MMKFWGCAHSTNLRSTRPVTLQGQNPVIPSGAARSGAGYRAFGGVVEGPFLPKLQQERSLHYAALRAAPVGMTVFFQYANALGDAGVETGVGDDQAVTS